MINIVSSSLPFPHLISFSTPSRETFNESLFKNADVVNQSCESTFSTLVTMTGVIKLMSHQ